MMQRAFCLALVLLSQPLFAQKTDRRLQEQVAALVAGFHGQVGVYVHDLKRNRIAAVQADSLFPTASIVKIPILLGITDRIRKGELEYNQLMTYEDTIHYDPGEDVLASFRPQEKILLSKLMLLSISLSDNTASLLLQGLAGGGIRINALLDSLGYSATRVNSRTAGREKDL
jgi:beta-lactamase class A